MGKWGKITENGSDSSRLLEKRALVRLMDIHNTGGSRMEKDVYTQNQWCFNGMMEKQIADGE